MTELLDKIILYWQFPFVRNALIVGVLIALCSSLLGVTLVLKRFSFIGDGLSHVAFGAMAVAGVLNFTNDMPFVMIVTIICALILLKTGQNSTIKGDAAVAMLSVSSLAVGYLVMNIFSTSSNLSLTLTSSEVYLSVILSSAVVLLFLMFYHKIFAVTFDEDFARASGINVNACNFFIAVIVAVVIVLAMKLVGSLLVSALVIFPALSAMRVFKSFKSVTLCSVIISVSCAFIGMIISILAGTPVGSTIVATDMIAFGIFYVMGRFIHEE